MDGWVAVSVAGLQDADLPLNETDMIAWDVLSSIM